MSRRVSASGAERLVEKEQTGLAMVCST
jgi:hypothetical protein